MMTSIGQLMSFLSIKSFVVTLLSLYCFRWLGYKIGLVDKPGGRKKHQAPVPMVGGLALFLGVSLTLTALYSQSVYVVFWLGCAVLVLISSVDDKFSLLAAHRFLLHFFIVAVMAVFGGMMITHLGDLVGGGTLVLGLSSLMFTGMSGVGVINAVNMMDGADGVTACVSLCELGLLLVLAVSGQFYLETTIILAFVGALLAFLPFNFPSKIFRKYRIFLGDTGSTLIGLVLVWLCIRLTQTGAHGYPPVLMLWLIALPLMDMGYLIINRKLRKISAFQPDRHHIHHILLRLNMTPRQTVGTLALASLLIGVMGIVLFELDLPESGLFFAWLMMFCLYNVVLFLLKKKLSGRHQMLRHTLGSY